MKKRQTQGHIPASRLESLLEHRYGDDHITQGEIKGVTGEGRLDFVAIRASWSHPDVHGFEIKVTRRDFLQDDKWPAYLDACQNFWFVTAPGIVDKKEIPEQAGWLEATRNCAKLYMRKKAPRRTMTPENQAKLFRQILHRRHYHSRWEDPQASRRRRLQEFMDAKAEDRKLGYLVGESVREAWRAMEQKVEKTEKAIAGYAAIARFLEGKGVKISQIEHLGRYGTLQNAGYLIERHAPELIRDTPVELDQLERAARALREAAVHSEQQISQAIQRIKKTCETEKGE